MIDLGYLLAGFLVVPQFISRDLIQLIAKAFPKAKKS